MTGDGVPLYAEGGITPQARCCGDAEMIVEHPCPQCGGAVTLEDRDRFLECGYCRVRLCIHTGRFPRYYITPKKETGETPVLVPYWHIRGMYFTVASPRSKSGTMDTSMLAAKGLEFMPGTLGFRTQTQRLRFASPEMDASYVAAAGDTGDIMDQAATVGIVMDSMAGLRKVHYRAFIGESASIIYAPYYTRERALYDAVTMRPSARLSAARAGKLEPTGRKKNWTLQFTAAICPHCGADLEGAGDSIVFICRNCDRAWRTRSRRFRRVNFEVGEPYSKQTQHLPFWRIEAAIQGVSAASYADIIRLANLPKVVRPEFENDRFYYWFPATRMSPASFKRMAKIVTLKRPRTFATGRYTQSFGRTRLAPVNIEPAEAASTITILLAELAIRKADFYPLLKRLKVKAEKSSLIYLPFDRVRDELIHRGMNLSLQANAFRET